MIKNFIENAKQTAQKVIHKEQKPQLEQMPAFESLAQKNYTVLQKEIWQYTQEDMNRVIQQMEDYIQRIQKAYNEVSESFNPLFIKFDMLEKERKRMAAELQESEKIKKELETAMVEMQQDFDNELRKKELMVFELDQTKKEIQALQSKVDWNNIDDTDVNDFGKELLELDKSQDEQYKKRIETLTQEVLDQIQLNKEQITKIQNLQNELDKQYQDNRNLNRNLSMVLQQLADVQTKSRQEIESKNQQINTLQNEMGKLNQKLNEFNQQQNMTMDLQMENEKLKEQFIDQQNKLKNNIQQFQQLNNKNKETQQLLNEQFELVKQLKQKRDIAILELNRLTSKQDAPLIVDRLKQIRYDLQAKLIQLRQDFEQIYKLYMQTVSQMDDNIHAQKLMQLENKMNSQILRIQNLIDEVEDLI